MGDFTSIDSGIKIVLAGKAPSISPARKEVYELLNQYVAALKNQNEVLEKHLATAVMIWSKSGTADLTRSTIRQNEELLGTSRRLINGADDKFKDFAELSPIGMRLLQSKKSDAELKTILKSSIESVKKTSEHLETMWMVSKGISAVGIGGWTAAVMAPIVAASFGLAATSYAATTTTALVSDIVIQGLQILGKESTAPNLKQSVVTLALASVPFVPKEAKQQLLKTKAGTALLANLETYAAKFETQVLEAFKAFKGKLTQNAVSGFGEAKDFLVSQLKGAAADLQKKLASFKEGAEDLLSPVAQTTEGGIGMPIPGTKIPNNANASIGLKGAPTSSGKAPGSAAKTTVDSPATIPGDKSKSQLLKEAIDIKAPASAAQKTDQHMISNRWEELYTKELAPGRNEKYIIGLDRSGITALGEISGQMQKTLQYAGQQADNCLDTISRLRKLPDADELSRKILSGKLGPEEAREVGWISKTKKVDGKEVLKTAEELEDQVAQFVNGKLRAFKEECKYWHSLMAAQARPKPTTVESRILSESPDLKRTFTRVIQNIEHAAKELGLTLT
jgi:hypothetical protein